MEKDDIHVAFAALDSVVQFLLAREMARFGADEVAGDLARLTFENDPFTGTPLEKADEAARARVEVIKRRIASIAATARDIMNGLA